MNILKIYIAWEMYIYLHQPNRDCTIMDMWRYACAKDRKIRGQDETRIITATF